MVAKEKMLDDAPNVEQLKARKKEAENARNKYVDNWERNTNLYNTKAWEGIPKIAPYQSEPQYNKVAEFVEIMRAMLADNKWGIDAIPNKTPEGGDTKDMSSKANNLLDFLWDDTQMQFILPQVFLHMFTKGTAFIKPVFDPENITHKGIGQIALDVVDPFYIYPDPDATAVDNADYIIQVQPVSLRHIIRKYPEKAGEVWVKGGTAS